jgi:predicted mannosyl-3-phosphoglycerate phosphatase (HAD superfamily)
VFVELVMNPQPHARADAKAAPALAESVVVITAVDGTLHRQHAGLDVQARSALDLLQEQGVPVVLWSTHCAADVIGLQSQLGFRHPFICRGGANLYVPRQYFGDPLGLGRAVGSWTVIDCGRISHMNTGGGADPAQAIRLLIGLYRVHCDDVLIVGVGSEWRDRDLLYEVDVPVVVRRDDCDQTRLLRRFPDVYVTRACGAAGWCEAILGGGEEA